MESVWKSVTKISVFRCAVLYGLDGEWWRCYTPREWLRKFRTHNSHVEMVYYTPYLSYIFIYHLAVPELYRVHCECAHASALGGRSTCWILWRCARDGFWCVCVSVCLSVWRKFSESKWKESTRTKCIGKTVGTHERNGNNSVCVCVWLGWFLYNERRGLPLHSTACMKLTWHFLLFYFYFVLATASLL